MTLKSQPPYLCSTIDDFIQIFIEDCKDRLQNNTFYPFIKFLDNFGQFIEVNLSRTKTLHERSTMISLIKNTNNNLLMYVDLCSIEDSEEAYNRAIAIYVSTNNNKYTLIIPFKRDNETVKYEIETYYFDSWQFELPTVIAPINILH